MAQFTTPGVYVEEVPSGVRVITGVATSITAFVGRALRGPTDTDAASPVRITNFAGYERIFGGLWAESPMSFAVQQFFANGGTEALIVRIHRHAKTARVRVPLSNGARVAFVAANPGAWGARVRIRIDHEVESVAAAAEPPDTLFNLHIRDLDTDVTEVHAAVSCVAGHPRFVSTVLAQTSGLLRGPATLASRPRASPPSTGPDVFAARGTRALTVAAEPDGTVVDAARLYAGRGLRTGKRGLYRLDHADRINLLVVPPYRFGSDLAKQDWDAVVAYASSRHAIALVDGPAAW
ncbi:MAG: hypothetical protein KIT73_09785, partial [Burkholderiales bacterium]|nr:hypothetical protein [Burkholderiales bacterium]